MKEERVRAVIDILSAEIPQIQAHRFRFNSTSLVSWQKEGETGAEEPTGLETLTRLPPELARLTSLQSLNLSGCRQLSGDLSPLAGLTSLQSLNLHWCEQLSGDLSPLAGLTSLQLRILAGCERLNGDLSPLASLASLQWKMNPKACDASPRTHTSSTN
jgi:hypothetical protein